jgi:hypothetical protein
MSPGVTSPGGVARHAGGPHPFNPGAVAGATVIRVRPNGVAEPSLPAAGPGRDFPSPRAGCDANSEHVEHFDRPVRPRMSQRRTFSCRYTFATSGEVAGDVLVDPPQH